MINEDHIIDIIINILTNGDNVLSKMHVNKERLKPVFDNSIHWKNDLKNMEEGRPLFINAQLIDDLYRHIIYEAVMSHIKETDCIRVEPSGDLTVIIDGESDYNKILTNIFKK